MQAPPFPVLYEDNHLLAVVKPAGIATMGVPRGGSPTVLEMVRCYVKAKYQKPGNVYLGVVSRLDAPVSGVLLIARTSKAAARLSEFFRTGAVEKTYWAVIEGRIEPPGGTMIDWLVHDERHRRVKTSEPPGLSRRSAAAKQARLDYRVLLHDGPRTLLEITLHTGRKHQIRVQMASRGHPIVGDRKYGSQTSFPAGIALHARRLTLVHPVRNVPLEFIAPLPPTWRSLGISLPE
jgi:23S rRNA pseudouridine1911/1915/1917 synthase